MRLLLNWVLSALAVWIVAQVVPGVYVNGAMAALIAALAIGFINATIGFEELSRRTKRPAKSLMRMLGPSGNPQARNLFEVIQHLQKEEGLHFELLLRAAS